MKRLISAMVVIMSLFNISAYTIINTPEELERIETMLDGGYLESGEKDELMRIKGKLVKYEVLTNDENEYIRQCYLNIIKKKLGDDKFQEYCKLLERRENAVEFTQPERLRLYQLEKEIKSTK